MGMRLKLHSSLKHPRHIQCPECFVRLQKVTIKGPGIKIYHPRVLMCSRSEQTVHLSQSCSVKGKDNGIAFLQIYTIVCPKCKNPLIPKILQCGLRVSFIHKLGLMDLCSLCDSQIIRPVASFIVFV